MNKLTIICAALAAIAFTGCATTHARVSQLDMQAMSAALEPQDVRATVEKMVDSMLDSAAVRRIQDQPVLDISGIQNRSTMHIDMVSITDSIRTKLLRSGQFAFMDRSTAAEDLQFMNDQALNGMTDPSKAIAMGQQDAAQMYLYGALSEMRQNVNGITDRYFKFTLNLKDLRSGRLIWADEQEIRKQQTRSVMGF